MTLKCNIFKTNCVQISSVIQCRERPGQQREDKKHD